MLWFALAVQPASASQSEYNEMRKSVRSTASLTTVRFDVPGRAPANRIIQDEKPELRSTTPSHQADRLFSKDEGAPSRTIAEHLPRCGDPRMLDLPAGRSGWPTRPVGRRHPRRPARTRPCGSATPVAHVSLGSQPRPLGHPRLNGAKTPPAPTRYHFRRLGAWRPRAFRGNAWRRESLARPPRVESCVPSRNHRRALFSQLTTVATPAAGIRCLPGARRPAVHAGRPGAAVAVRLRPVMVVVAPSVANRIVEGPEPMGVIGRLVRVRRRDNAVD